jgi:hypothetical protein
MWNVWRAAQDERLQNRGQKVLCIVQIRHSHQLGPQLNFHPENNLVYFPTDEDWMVTTRPFKVPFEDKFPARFNVCSLPLPNQTACLPPTRPIVKRNKRRNNNTGAGQAVLENFFTNEPADTHTETGELPEVREDDSEDEYDTQLDNAIGDLSANFLRNINT